MNKGLFRPAVVPVEAGKVEIARITALGLGLRQGRVLENLAVELRASGKTAKDVELRTGEFTVPTAGRKWDVDLWVGGVESAAWC